MRITIAAIGRARRGPEADLYRHYAHRLMRWPLTLREAEVRRQVGGSRATEAEAALLQRSIPQGATTVALDEGGTALSSTAFADRLRGWEERATSDLAFIIGGADGLDRSLTQGAALTLALGPMTWPHLLARGLLAEQLYRAQQILAGHPYHRG